MPRASIKMIGLTELRAQLAQAGAQAPQMLSGALYREANFVMRKSVEVVPVDTGVLRGSHVVLKPVRSGSRIGVVFGYGGAASAYALAVHENPRAGKTGGVSPSGSKRRFYAKTGQWKFLEGPAHQWFPTSAQRMALDLHGIFERKAGNAAAADELAQQLAVARPRQSRLARRRR